MPVIATAGLDIGVQIEVEDQSVTPGAGIAQPERALCILTIAGRAETDEVGLQTVENVARRLSRAVRQLRGG